MGIGEAFAPGGVIGPVFPRRRARQLQEAQDADRRKVVSAADIGIDELVSGAGDPELAAAFNDQFKTFKSMALSSDESVQREGLSGLSALSTAVRQGIEKRRADMSTRVLDTAKDMRGEAQKALKPMRDMQANTEEGYALLADAEFDQNLALNRGSLISLLQSNARQMLTDPDDMADALRSVNGGGLLGSVIQLAAGKMAADDFEFTKEDYRRLFDASYTFQQKKYAATMAPIAREASQLEQAAGGLDLFPQGYSLSTYILSDPEEFTKPVQTSFPEPAPRTPTLGSVASGTAGLVDSIKQEIDRPAREAGERADVTEPLPGGSTPFPGLNGASFGLADLFSRMGTYGPQATFKADPKSGRVFAYLEDGTRTEVNTGGGVFGSGGERAKVRDWLENTRRVREYPRKGVIDRSEQ